MRNNKDNKIELVLEDPIYKKFQDVEEEIKFLEMQLKYLKPISGNKGENNND